MYKKVRNGYRDLDSKRPHIGADEIDLDCGFTICDSVRPGLYGLGIHVPSVALSVEHRLHPGALRNHRDQRRSAKRGI